jgi:hypothetical protein
MKRSALLIAVASLTLAGCASTTGSTASGTTPNPAASESLASIAARQSSAAAAAASAIASAASAPCTTHACIASDLDQSLVGGVAQDEAVATKVTCYKKTVEFHKAADTYSAYCVVTYSDGSQATGTGNLLMKSQKVTFQPTGT